MTERRSEKAILKRIASIDAEMSAIIRFGGSSVLELCLLDQKEVLEVYLRQMNRGTLLDPDPGQARTIGQWISACWLDFSGPYSEMRQLEFLLRLPIDEADEASTPRP